jgi:hypothetical protein
MQIGPSDTFIANKAISLSEDLTGTEKRVGATLIDHYNRKTGQCDPALNSMSRLLGVSRRTIIRAVGTLVQKGYFRKTRHGGKFHRNSYEPIWSRFRANERKWNDLRTAARRFKAAEMSPLQGRGCHLDGDADGTQTYSNNTLKQNLPAGRPANQIPASNEPIVRERLSRAENSKVTYRMAEERFHVKPASSNIAARDAAERRWNVQLTKQFLAAPDVFGNVVDAIDVDLRNATTDIELKKPGAGIFFLMSELDRRSPLGGNQSPGPLNKSDPQSRDVSTTDAIDCDRVRASADKDESDVPGEGDTKRREG